MSKVKFSFEGEAEDLVYILQFMSPKSGCSGGCDGGKRDTEDLTEPYLPLDQSAPIQQHVLDAGWKPQPESRDVQAAQAAAMLARDLPYNLDPITPAVMGEPITAETNIFKTAYFYNLPLKPEAWSEFVGVIQAWAKNFRNPEAEQANRLELLTDMGRSRWTVFILRHIIAYKSLQGAIRAALQTDDLDLVADIAGNLLQCSHVAFPDLASDECFDHSTKWRRDAMAEIAARTKFAESYVASSTPIGIGD